MIAARIAVRCPNCQLNQFLTDSKYCRKCNALLLPAPPALVAVEVHSVSGRLAAKVERLLAKIRPAEKPSVPLRKPCVSVVSAPRKSVVMDKDLATLYEELVARGVLLRDTIEEKAHDASATR